MIAESVFEPMVRNYLEDGLTATQIARRTGVPLPRVQRTVHRIRGTDPDRANRITGGKRRQAAGHTFGGAAIPCEEPAGCRSRDTMFQPGYGWLCPDHRPAPSPAP